MKKTGHYRRVIWLSDEARNDLGALIEDCLEHFAGVALPRFPLEEGTECLIARKSFSGGKRYLHFVTFEAGAPVAVIRTAIVTGDTIEATEREPTDDHEYILSQLFCLIQGNDVLWATHNTPMREASILALFYKLIESCGLGGDQKNTLFNFQVVLNEAKVSAILANGIQEIDLGLGGFRPTLERVVNGGELDSGGLLSAIASMVKSTPSAQDLEASEKIEAKLVLRTGRSWDHPAVMDLMSTMSKNIRDGFDDEFVIVTKSGLRFTKEKLSLQKPFEVSGNKRVLSSSQVDSELRAVFADLESEGILDV